MAASKPCTRYGSRYCGSAMVEALLELARAPYRIVSADTWDKRSALDRRTERHSVVAPVIVHRWGAGLVSKGARVA